MVVSDEEQRHSGLIDAVFRPAQSRGAGSNLLGLSHMAQINVQPEDLLPDQAS